MWATLVVVALGAPGGADGGAPEAMVSAFYGGIDAMALTVPVEASLFDAFILDDAGKPVRLSGAEGLARFEALLAGWKAQGYSAVTRVDDARCHVDKRAAWCGATLSQELLMGGELVDRLALRVTMTMVRTGGAWRMAQVHESPNG